MKITIETEPKEIADLIVALQGQQDSKSSFVPCDSSGYPFEHSQSQEDSLPKIELLIKSHCFLFSQPCLLFTTSMTNNLLFESR